MAMASTLPPQNLLPIPVVAIVIDSSITLAAEWHHILNDYFPHLLRRLAGGVPSSLAVNPSLIVQFLSLPSTLPCHVTAPPPRIRHLWTPGL
jgi:hypothetical protein